MHRSTFARDRKGPPYHTLTYAVDNPAALNVDLLLDNKVRVATTARGVQLVGSPSVHLPLKARVSIQVSATGRTFWES